MDNRLNSWISKVTSRKDSAKPEHPRAPEAAEHTPPPQADKTPSFLPSSPPPAAHPAHPGPHKGRPRTPFRKPQHAQHRPQISQHVPQPEHRPEPQHGKGGARLRAIPLGGLNEVGRNCMCLEYGEDIIIVDAGLQFPEPGTYGVNYILPDTRYVEQKKQNIRAIIITHAHLDHIGGLAYLLPRLNFPPVYAPPLSAGLIERQLKEREGMERAKIIKVNSEKDILRFGNFTIEYFHVNHSIPDANGLYIQTPSAKVVHTGDFKFDFMPADGIPADFSKIAQIGGRGVDAIFADSTNAQKEGFCISEKVVAETLERIIRNTHKGRLFITSFSSVLARWQQVIRFAQKYNRKIYVTGRSLLENLRIASDMNYIRIPHGLVHKVTKRMHDVPANEQLIITTGAQGEENAALSRIARGEHDIIKVERDDTVVFSSSAIPGNEHQLTTVINNLYKVGAKVITKNQLDVHTSGHAYQGDLKLMYALIKPKNIIPVHGEYNMRVDHARMVRDDLGYDEKNIAIISNGDVLEIANGEVRKTTEKVPGEHLFVDGKTIGDNSGEIQKERKALLNSGVISLIFRWDPKERALRQRPKMESLGFAYPQEIAHLTERIEQEAFKVMEHTLTKYHDLTNKEAAIKRDVEERLGGFITELTERTPRIMITMIEK